MLSLLNLKPVQIIKILAAISCVAVIWWGYHQYKANLKEQYDTGYSEGHAACVSEYNKEMMKLKLNEKNERVALTKRLKELKEKLNEKKNKELDCKELYAIPIPAHCLPGD